jgi:hypothetical protein
LSYNPNGPYTPISTAWTVQVAYGGSNSPVYAVSGGAPLNASIDAKYPGTYTVTAVASYMSTNPTVNPPGRQTTTGTLSVPAPSGVAKDGPLGVRTNFMTSIWITDPVTALGLPIGPTFVGWSQENIPPINFPNGYVASGTNGWWPQNGPEPSFYVTSSSTISDQFSMDEAELPNFPVGVLCTFTQRLQMAWEMPTEGGGYATFTVPLGSLTWTWSKVDASNWESTSDGGASCAGGFPSRRRPFWVCRS